MKKQYAVELDDNEVLIKFTIDTNDMGDFLGRTVQMTDYVCNTPLFDGEEDKQQEYARAMLEDSIYSTLCEGNVASTYEVLVSPVNSESYLNGEYDDIRDTYIANETVKIVEGFFKDR